MKWGADLIVGAHPHVVQPIKIYDTKTNEGTVRKKLVAYSLGNFISNQLRANTDGGIMLEIELEKDLVNKKIRLSDYAYLPVWRQKGTKEKPFRILPVIDFENGSSLLRSSELKQLKRFATKTRQHLSRFDCPEKTTSEHSFE